MRNNDQKSLTTPCNKLSQLGLVVEKGGIYVLTLGFYKQSGESRADFEKRLQTDFDGEIAIGDVNSEPISIIKYHDFSGFAESPSGATYGPVYIFNVDCPWNERRYLMISPKISEVN